MARLFSLVSEALAGATDALLAGEPAEGSRVVAGDESVDELTDQLSERIWEDFERLAPASHELRGLVGLLLILPELERSADLAEHIAHSVPSPTSARTCVPPEPWHRPADVRRRPREMWHEAAQSYMRCTAVSALLEEADEELDILHERLTNEVATSAAMPPPVAAQVTLLGRFYERLGDHAVNLAKRIELLPTQNTGQDS